MKIELLLSVAETILMPTIENIKIHLIVSLAFGMVALLLNNSYRIECSDCRFLNTPSFHWSDNYRHYSSRG